MICRNDCNILLNYSKIQKNKPDIIKIFSSSDCIMPRSDLQLPGIFLVPIHGGSKRYRTANTSAEVIILKIC